jgi:CheY-like chemotaxis protein
MNNNMPKRVLVVEDERNIRLLVMTILRKEGYEVFEADNGVKALLILEKSPTFDLVVTDIMMPEMDGIEMTEKVREQYPDLPIIVMCASPDPANKALAKGANYYLSKPFSYSKFKAILDTPSEPEIE